MKPYNLSKSKFIAGLQCPKRLWLQVHTPELVERDCGENLQVLNGNEVGKIARQLFPGTLVKYDNGLEAALEKTTRLVADNSALAIHEATFVYEGILVRVDLLLRSPDGWILAEVKGATSVKPHYIPDAAIQAWVLQGCGLNLEAIRLMHVNNQFIYQGDSIYDGFLITEDISDQVNALLGSVPNQKASFIAVLKGYEPDVEMGSHCNDPYECEFYAYCQPTDLPEYPVTLLPNLREPKKSELTAEYSDLRDIPKSELSNKNHLRVWRATCSGKEELNLAEALVLRDLPWPRYYLDFETIALAVPRWKGVQPYMQVPFQWSCHIHYQDGRIEHAEFLDVSGSDPRLACAKALVKCIGNKGVLIAYNAGFEKRVIRDLAEFSCSLSNPLLKMNERFVDLLPITRKTYYHPSQMGSWSIKAVLPALVPELSYATLDGVQNGADAQLAWMQAAQAKPEDREKIADQLLEYCKLDTLAMVKIVDALLDKAEDTLFKENDDE